MARNQKQLRDAFWDRKRADAEAGERWLAANPETPFPATIAAR